MERKNQYDIMKGIGIILVIMCHAGLGGFAKEFIYSFHMPLFFFVSGCFFRNSELGKFLIKNIKQLLIPYLFFVICMITVKQVRSTDFLFSISSTFLNLDITNESDSFLYESIWFLVCLFEVRIVYWIVYNVFGKHYVAIIFVSAILFICGNCLHYFNVDLPFFIDTTLSVIVFYAAGDLFKKKGFENCIIPKWIIPIVIFVCFGICYFLRPDVEIKLNIYPCYLILVTLPMILALYYSSLFLSKFQGVFLVKFLQKAGVSSLCILGLHNQVFYLIGPHLFSIHTPPHAGILLIIILCIITICLVFIIEKFINKYLPFLLGKF